MRFYRDKMGLPVFIIFDPVPLFEVPIVGGVFAIGARIDVSSLIHLLTGFLLGFIGFWFTVAFTLGGERSDGTNSDQGADPMDVIFAMLGLYLKLKFIG